MNGQSSNYGGSTSTPGNSATTALPPVDPAQLLQAFATMQQFTNVMNMSGVQFPWPGAMPQLPAMPALPQLNMQPFQDPSLNQPMAPENDDKILISQLVEYRKRDGSYREALDTLHGVRTAAICSPLRSSSIRGTTTQQACGRTITWITNTGWTHGLSGACLKNPRPLARVRLLNAKNLTFPL